MKNKKMKYTAILTTYSGGTVANDGKTKTSSEPCDSIRESIKNVGLGRLRRKIEIGKMYQIPEDHAVLLVVADKKQK